MTTTLQAQKCRKWLFRTVQSQTLSRNVCVTVIPQEAFTVCTRMSTENAHRFRTPKLKTPVLGRFRASERPTQHWDFARCCVSSPNQGALPNRAREHASTQYFPQAAHVRKRSFGVLSKQSTQKDFNLRRCQKTAFGARYYCSFQLISKNQELYKPCTLISAGIAWSSNTSNFNKFGCRHL